MRRLLLLFIALSFSAVAGFGQSLTYSFQNSFAEDNGRGPALIPLDTGHFRIDTLPCTGEIRPVYHYGTNSGLSFDNRAAGHWMGNSYTIEIFYKIDDLGRYRRVLDWKNRTTDWGAYVYYGRLNFYNIATSDTIPFEAGRYQYYVVTRDSATQMVRIYSSGTSNVKFVDTDTNATLNNAQVLHFFQDDLVVANEAISGSVARIQIHRQALDSLTIHSRFTNICGLLGTRENVKSTGRLRLTPNPATSATMLELPGATGTWTYTLHAADGRLIRTGTAHTSQAEVDLEGLPQGLYTIRSRANGKAQSLRLLKQ